MNLQNCGTHDLNILKFKVSLGNRRHFSRFKVTFNINQEIYYYEKGDGLVLSPRHVSVRSPRQIHDPKLVPFAINTCIVQIVHVVCLKCL
jgi:hypothetical protein